MPDPIRPAGPPADHRQDHEGMVRLTETLVPALVAKLSSSGLGELEIREGDWRIRLRRPPAAAPGGGVQARRERPRHAPHPPERAARDAHAPAGNPGHGPANPGHEPDGAASADLRRAIATSPTVGVFRPGPRPGSRVRAGDRVATVDLLGIPQDVVSPVDGTLVEVFPEAGDAVEYGEEVAVVEADPPAAPAGGGEG